MRPAVRRATTHRVEAKAWYGRSRQVAVDVLANMSSVALFICSAALFLGGAFAGIGLVSRLGGAGWLMYSVVIGTYALVFGPVIASAVTLRQRGSARHRAALAERRREQRIKYQLDRLEAEDAPGSTGADGGGQQRSR
jgi:hypothetical protein